MKAPLSTSFFIRGVKQGMHSSIRSVLEGDLEDLKRIDGGLGDVWCTLGRTPTQTLSYGDSHAIRHKARPGQERPSSTSTFSRLLVDGKELPVCSGIEFFNVTQRTLCTGALLYTNGVALWHSRVRSCYLFIVTSTCSCTKICRYVGSHHKRQVLELMSRMLNFTDQENQQVRCCRASLTFNLKRSGMHSSCPSATLKTAPDSSNVVCYHQLDKAVRLKSEKLSPI